MDYQVMLDFHKANHADITMATIPVPIEEASRFGVCITDDTHRILEFEEKPEHPRSNLASMGIYIFSWPVLKEALIQLKDQKGCDFGKHILPYCHERGDRIFAFEYNGYWKDVGTVDFNYSGIALNDLKNEIGGIAVDIAGKVVEREINETDHKALIDEFIRNVGDAS